MKIISHRGLWLRPDEKNTRTAFQRSFFNGFGTETDIRDYCGDLIISHDVPDSVENLSLGDFLDLVSRDSASEELTLALNIKADGLAAMIKRVMSKYPSLDYFLFDMAVPDLREYIRNKLPVFSRVSEVERYPVWLDSADGIWLDSFDSNWFNQSNIEYYLDKGMRVCVVSSELHGRNHKELWRLLKPLENRASLILCTDKPELARNYFSR